MNAGVMVKSIRETWVSTLLFGVALAAVEGLLGYVFPTFAARLADQWLRLPFIQNIIKAMVGADVAGAGPELFRALPWVHPVPLALVWAHGIVFCTRVPAGEVDRGTADVLLGLPVSRWGLHVSETVVWVAGVVLMLVLAAIGNAVGGSMAGARVTAEQAGMIVVNLMGVALAVGAGTWVISAVSDRRGRAIGAAFSLVVLSFLLNYLAQHWKPAERMAFLSVLHYYRPLELMRTGAWPWRDIGVLAGAAAVMWSVAGWWSSRRDLMTV